MHDPEVLRKWQQGAPDVLYHGSDREKTLIGNSSSTAAHPYRLGEGKHPLAAYLTAEPRFARQFGKNVYKVTGHDKSNLYPDPEIIPFDKHKIPNSYTGMVYTKRIPSVEKMPESPDWGPKDAAKFALRNPRTTWHMLRQIWDD
jgi:hypothetical protein